MAISDISINNILIAREVASSDELKLDGDLAKHRSDYDKKQEDIEHRKQRDFAAAATGGFLTDAANRFAGSARGVSPVMARTSLELPGPPPMRLVLMKWKHQEPLFLQSKN